MILIKLLSGERINARQLQQELKAAGLSDQFTYRLPPKNVIIFYTDDARVKTVLAAHSPDDILEASLSPPKKTSAEIKTESIAKIDGLNTIEQIKEYLKQMQGLS